MTLVEFIAPVKTGANRVKVLVAMYFLHRYEGVDAMRAEEIKTALKGARVPQAGAMNVPDVLNKSGHFVDSPRSDGVRRLWKLTSSGEQEVRRILGLPDAEPEIEHDVAVLTKLVASVADKNANDFLTEAVTCLQFGALRASVVFVWSGAVTVLRQEVWKSGASQVNAALLAHDPKSRKVTKLEDFAYVKDVRLLELLFDLETIDKTEKTILGHALDLRNSCGHPTKYRPGAKRVSGFVEDVIGIVFR
jgi:hypothetical protein